MHPLEAARTRYTTKHYDAGQPLEEEKLEALLEVLRLAPSSVNIQPWRFHVVASEEARRALMPAVKDFNIDRVANASAVIIFTIRRDVASDAFLDRLFEKEKADGRYAPDAPAGDIDALRRNAVRDYCRTPESLDRWTSEQAHIALGFALMAAAETGVDSTVLGGLWFDQVDRILELEKTHEHAVVGLALGHRAKGDANALRPKSRLTADEVVVRH